MKVVMLKYKAYEDIWRYVVFSTISSQSIYLMKNDIFRHFWIMNYNFHIYKIWTILSSVWNILPNVHWLIYIFSLLWELCFCIVHLYVVMQLFIAENAHLFVGLNGVNCSKNEKVIVLCTLTSYLYKYDTHEYLVHNIVHSMETDEWHSNLTKGTWAPIVIWLRLDVGQSSEEAHSRVNTLSLLVSLVIILRQF